MNRALVRPRLLLVLNLAIGMCFWSARRILYQSESSEKLV